MNDSEQPVAPEPIGNDGSQRFTTADYRSVQKAILQRRTIKVLANSPPCVADRENEPGRAVEKDLVFNDYVRQAIADSGWAPFHYDRQINGISEPWRCHVLWRPQCVHVGSRINDWFDDVKPNNKTIAMLSACGALVLVNWLPQFGTGSNASSVPGEKQIQIDQEHIAATAAAIQNLLLLLTARNLGTYWSSGGLFRTDTMFEKLGIDQGESLLGAIFVDYGPEHTQDANVERIPGKNRNLRTDYRKWVREIVF